jgi:chromosomal replication initiator protein
VPQDTLVDIWNEALRRIQEHLARRSFDTWIRPIALLEATDDTVTLGVPSSFFQDWVEEHYRPLLQEALDAVTGRPSRLRFLVTEAAPAVTPGAGNGDARDEGSAPAGDGAGADRACAPPGHGLGRVSPLVSPPATRRAPVAAAQRRGPLPGIHERHTFEHFVVGASNEFAYAAALGVVDQPGLLYNPLFVYGGVGLGKTHLLHAIGHRIAQRNPAARVYYLTSEKFMTEMIRSIQRGTTMDFKRKYRSLDVLLIDDIQFLSGKESTQEEFFHTFNALYDAQKQIILTADCPPKEISGLEERLVSRVSWGLVADIQLPDLETRVAILRKFAELKEIEIDDDVALLIARNVKTNIRDLEGCLNRLHALAASARRRIDVDFASRMLGDLFRGHHQALSPRRIMHAVCSVFEVSPEVLVSKKRTKAVALPRQIAMYFMRTQTSLSLVEIGRRIGDRDHSTVIHAVDKIERVKTQDVALRAKMAKVARELGVDLAS